MPDTVVHLTSSNTAIIRDRYTAGQLSLWVCNLSILESNNWKIEILSHLFHVKWYQLSKDNQSILLFLGTLFSFSCWPYHSPYYSQSHSLTRLMSCVHSWNYSTFAHWISPAFMVQLCTSLLKASSQGTVAFTKYPPLHPWMALFTNNFICQLSYLISALGIHFPCYLLFSKSCHCWGC